MEIRDYVQQAHEEPSTENIEALWRAVFTLKAWYFVPASDEEGPTRPMVTVLDGQHWMPAFTGVRTYRAFVEETGRASDDGELHGLLLDPGEAMQRIVEVREAVTGVVFNPGTSITFRAPVDALEEYALHFEIPKFSGG